MPTPLPITDRAVRVGIVGLGQIAELCLAPYRQRADVEVVALCDLAPSRIERWHSQFPSAITTDSLDEVFAAQPDVIDVLVPTPNHADVVVRCLDAGFHVQVQKPLARSLADADRMVAAARDHGCMLRVMEDYIHFGPLVKLREIVDAGEIGVPQAMHMKIVATPTGGWDVDAASYEWQFEQARDGHGILTFDHGWHQLAVAHWLFGEVTRVFGWIRRTELGGGFVLDTPATFIWEHANGVRVVLEIVLAPEMYFRSDYYADDERVEVTGTKGYVRCNRISGRGVQEPSVVRYRDGEIVAYHALDDRPPDAFAASAAHGIGYLRGEHDDLLLDGETARTVLHTLLAALESARIEAPIDVV
ncbi:MAG TPA: Gfo/Idh/MocA family oxidoreductase [Acidimicrobiia bacterium]